MSTSHQKYTNVVAITRMEQGRCPECGNPPSEHSGWGGSGCGLTDNGVAGRIYQFELDKAKAAKDAVLVASMPGTGDCHTEGCPGSYDAWGKCHTCGAVD